LLTIDAHQHFWNLSRATYSWLGPALAPIDRTIEFDELAPILASTGVDATVLVQSADNADDTAYMLEVADAHPEIAGVVGWVPLDRPDEAGAMLPQLQRHPAFVGVRNLIHDIPDPDWLLRSDVNEGLGLLADAQVPFDVVAVLPRHLEHVPTLVERHPGLRMVIDHLAKPPVGQADWEPWRSLIRRAAESPNVYAKVSGLYPSDPAADLTAWGPDDIAPFVDFALEIFGPERLMFGGDWPISVLAGGYPKVWSALTTVFDRYDEPVQAALRSRTAIDFYRLPSDRLPGGAS
jgi:L-fuconolactonase